MADRLVKFSDRLGSAGYAVVPQELLKPNGIREGDEVWVKGYYGGSLDDKPTVYFDNIGTLYLREGDDVLIPIR